MFLVWGCGSHILSSVLLGLQEWFPNLSVYQSHPELLLTHSYGVPSQSFWLIRSEDHTESHWPVECGEARPWLP